jgi:hypothetical protein
MKPTAVTTAAITLSLIAATSGNAFAGGDSATTASPQVVPAPATTENIPSLSSNQPIAQSSGFTQNNGYGYGNLGYPACGGLCVFAIGKTSVTGNTSTAEAMVGVIWQIDSPEKTNAQATLRQVQIQQDALEHQNVSSLTEKLADAIEKNLPERVNIIAIVLAKKLGYSNHRQFLAEVYNIDTTRSAQKPLGVIPVSPTPKTQIDVPVNY